MEAEQGAGSTGDRIEPSDTVAERRRALKRLGLTAAAAPRLRLRDGLRVEEFDGELVVLDPSGATVHRVTGDGVAALRLLEQGVSDHDVPAELADAVDALADAGLVSGRGGLSRRAAIAAGGATAWAAATVTTFALADPAAAWSTCRNGKTPTPNDPSSTGKKYTTAGTHTWTSGPSGFHDPNTQQSYNVLVRAWGGGGGGGDDGCSYGGGGGGGGAYAQKTISVLECTDYTVTVGAGGAAKNDGSRSVFKDDSTLKAAAGKKGATANCGGGGAGGSGGSTADSEGSTKWAGGSGGGGGSYSNTATGGGSAGSTGNGGNGGSDNRGAAGPGTPGGARGGDDEDGQRNGEAPGGGGAGDGGAGAPGAVWVGV